MALSASLRNLCEEVLAEFDERKRQVLNRKASELFAAWRKVEVVREPNGMRSGKTLADLSFLSEADLVRPFLDRPKSARVSTSISNFERVHVAAALILLANSSPHNESEYAEWFTQETKSAAQHRGREQFAAEIEPFLSSMRTDRRVMQDGRSKGGRVPKEARALKEFISEEIAKDPKFNPRALTRALKPYYSQDVSLNYKDVNHFWLEDELLCCESEGERIKRLKKSAIARYFTEARKKIPSN